MSLVDEVQSNDRRRALVAMRDALAEHMSQAEPNVVAQIAARLQAVLDSLAALPAEVEKVPVKDDLKARRANRIAAAKAQASAAGKGVQRGS